MLEKVLNAFKLNDIGKDATEAQKAHKAHIDKTLKELSPEQVLEHSLAYLKFVKLQNEIGEDIDKLHEDNSTKEEITAVKDKIVGSAKDIQDNPIIPPDLKIAMQQKSAMLEIMFEMSM